MIQIFYLIAKELFCGRFISLIVFFSILVSALSFGLFQIIGDNFNSYVQNKFASSIPPNTIKVTSVPDESFLFFNIRNPKTPVLDDRVLGRIKALKGVMALYPVMLVRAPVQAHISLFGLRYSTDLLCMGAPYRFIKDDLAGDRYRAMWENPENESNIPVLFPRILLKAYNEGMAEPNRLPKIKESFITGMAFEILFGYSSLRKMKDFIKAEGTIAGFTDSINSLAIIIPIKAAEYYNRKFNEGNPANEYLYAFVNVAGHDSLLAVSSAIKNMGLIAEVEKKISGSILNLKNNVNLVVNMLKYLIIMLALLAVSFSTMIATFNRMEYYRILRILGATKYFIAFTVIFKYFLIGLMGSFSGLWLIRYFAKNITDGINISIIKISFSMPEDIAARVMILGALIPVASTLPGLFRLFSKKLNRD